MNIYKAFPVFIFLIFIFFSKCDTTDPPPPDTRKLTLTFEDASCTEAWIKLTTENLQLPAEINLTRTDEGGNSVSHISILNTKDSLFYIDSLLPNKSYTFKAELSSIQHPVSSNELNVTTMDTTSHNFTFETFTFGDYNPSTLFDVAIIDENNILAVGEIYLFDSLGNEDPTPYNAIHWNGTEWKVIRIPYFYQGQPYYHPIQSVFAFGSSDIWFGGNGIIHWDGIQYNPIPIPSGVWGPYLINKIWGISSNDFYIVGAGGNIACYRNGQWTKLESGTDVDLLDVWGSPDGSLVWACGYYRDRPGTFLLRSTGGNFEMAFDGTANEFKILQDTISGAMTSVYTPNEKRIFIGSSAGIYSASSSTRGEGKRLSFTPTFFPGFPNKLTGNNINDLTIVGDYTFIGHYNGFSWRYFDEFYSEDNRFWSVAQKNNLIITVGRQRISPIYGKALINLGRR